MGNRRRGSHRPISKKATTAAKLEKLAERDAEREFRAEGGDDELSPRVRNHRQPPRKGVVSVTPINSFTSFTPDGGTAIDLDGVFAEFGVPPELLLKGLRGTPRSCTHHDD